MMITDARRFLAAKKIAASVAGACLVVLSTTIATDNANAARKCRVHRPGCHPMAHLSSHQRAIRKAPRVEVAGKSLIWGRVAGYGNYVLATKTPGRPYEYAVVKSTSAPLTTHPGTTVTYRVRTRVNDSAWSPYVTITDSVQDEPSAATSSSSPAVTAAAGQGNGTSKSTTTAAVAPTTEGVGVNGSIEESSTSQDSPSTNFEEPFVKGIDTNLQGWGVEAVPRIATEMRTLGANWEREDLAWSTVEPQPGVFNWSSFDQIVAAAQTNGITILPILGYAPSWASPSDAADYASFVKAAVERYGPGTSANLQWWELWNEPYASYAWSGQTPDAEAYARDALSAAEAAKSVSPSVKLLIAAEYNDSSQTGGSSPWETTWVDDMFTAAPTLGQWFAGVAVHPYGGDPGLPLEQPGSWKNVNGEWAFQRIDTIRAQFLAHGVNIPFWVTEDGWSTWEVSEANQAQDYTELIKEIAARPWIRAYFPYCLREDSSKPTNNQSGFGLLKFGSWEPKPAFYTLQSGFKTLS